MKELLLKSTFDNEATLYDNTIQYLMPARVSQAERWFSGSERHENPGGGIKTGGSQTK